MGIVSLSEAANRHGLSRKFIRTLLAAGKIGGSYQPALRRWQIDAEPLASYLASKGIATATRASLVSIAVVGASAEWFAEFSGRLPPGHSAAHAATAFDAGRCFELLRPTVAVIDCRIGRQEALDLGRRLSGTRVKCIALLVEDEGHPEQLLNAGYGKLIPAPWPPAAVADLLR